MSKEVNKKEPIAVVKEVPYFPTKVERNEEKKDLVYPAPSKEYIIDEFKKVEDVLKNSGFISPLFNAFPLSNFFARTGFSKLKQNCQTMAEDCCEVDLQVHPVSGKEVEVIDYSTFDLQEFVKLVEEGRVTSRGLTMDDLKREREELTDEMIGEGEYKDAGEPTPERQTEIFARLRQIKLEEASKKRAPRTKKPATTEATPVAA